MLRRLRSIRKRPAGRVLRAVGLVALLWLVVTGHTPSFAVDESADAAKAPTAPVVPAGSQASDVAIITILTPISSVTSRTFERRLALAEKAGVDGLVVELDTPGGEVGAVLEITSMIRASSIPLIVAWINEDAFSGGAFIALACDEIVVSPRATLGDAAPINMAGMLMGQSMSPTERIKVLMPLLADLTESARAAGYDENLVQAMVVLGVETWMVRHRPTGEKFFLTAAEYQCLFGSEPPEGRARSGLAASGGSSVPVGPLPSTLGSDDPDDFQPASGELTFSPEDYESLNMSIAGRSKRPDFCQESAPEYEYVERATDGQTLLTMNYDDLVDYGFAKGTVDTDSDLEGYLGSSNMYRLNENWSERVFGPMLASMWWGPLRFLCMIIFLIALFVEMSAPGMGIPGVIALLALSVVLVPPVLVNAALWWTFAAVVLGVLLILAEIFVFPGFGVSGIAGLVSLMTGLVGSFASLSSTIPGTGADTANLTWAVSMVLAGMFIAGIGMYFFSRYTHSFPVAGQMILHTKSAPAETMLEAMAPAPVDSPVAVGDIGKVMSTLRPSGTAEFGERLVDVVSEGGFVEAGSRVRVTSVGYRVMVELLDDQEAPGGEDLA